MILAKVDKERVDVLKYERKGETMYIPHEAGKGEEIVEKARENYKSRMILMYLFIGFVVLSIVGMFWILAIDVLSGLKIINPVFPGFLAALVVVWKLYGDRLPNMSPPDSPSFIPEMVKEDIPRREAKREYFLHEELPEEWRRAPEAWLYQEDD